MGKRPKPGEKGKSPFTAEQQLQICAWLAAGWNCSIVADYCLEHFDVEVSRQAIRQTYLLELKWKKIVAWMRKKAHERALRHPLADKKHQLDVVQAALNEAMTWRTDKLYFNKHGACVGKVEKRNLGAVAALISTANAIVNSKALIQVGEGGKLVFQDIDIDMKGKDAGAKVKALTNRLSAQSGR